MTRPRLTRRIQDSRVQRQVGEFPVSAPTGRKARFGDPTLMERAGMRAQLGAFEGEGRNVTQGPFLPFIADFLGGEEDDRERLPPEELNRRFGDLGLKFDHPLTEQAAELLAENRRAELIRQSIIRREPSGFGTKAAGFGVDLVNMAMDPLEIATAFVPAVSAAKHAAWIARHGAIAGRVRVGVVEGFAGNLMMEPAYMALSDQLQMDYGMADGIANVFLGSVLGGALGGGVGAAMRGRRRLTLTEDMRVRRGEAEPINLDTLDVGTALNLSREQRALLPAPVEGRSGLTLHPAIEQATPDVEARVRGLNQRLRKLHARRAKASRPDTISRLDEEIASVRAERDQIQAVPTRMELVDAEGNVIPLEPDQQAALAAAVNGPSAAQRGQALKGAIAQMAQGKSVRVAETAEELAQLKNRERLARGRVTQIRNELARVRAEGDTERVRDLEGRLERAEGQHQLEKARLEGDRTAVAQRVAEEEQRIERSSTYDADAVRRLDEAQKQDPLPEDDAVQQEVDSIVAEFEQAVERGELTEEQLDNVRNELKVIDAELASGTRITEFLKTCLKR